MAASARLSTRCARCLLKRTSAPLSRRTGEGAAPCLPLIGWRPISSQLRGYMLFSCHGCAAARAASRSAAYCAILRISCGCAHIAPALKLRHRRASPRLACAAHLSVCDAREIASLCSAHISANHHCTALRAPRGETLSTRDARSCLARLRTWRAKCAAAPRRAAHLCANENALRPACRAINRRTSNHAIFCLCGPQNAPLLVAGKSC